MKLYISADMEGISGIVSMNQVEPGKSDYQRARQLMTKEVNTVIEAAYDYGATEVVVNDSHSNMDNILIEDLHPGATLISGSPKPFSMMEGINESFDAVFLIGYHARPGTPGAVIDHTYTFRVLEAKINGLPVGEAGLNGRLAGYYGVPVVLISGDQRTVSCAMEELNEPVGVIVKESIGRNSARLYPFDIVKERIKSGVAQALNKRKSIEPTFIKGKIDLEVTFILAEMAQMAMLIPGVKRINNRTVGYTSEEYLDIFKVFRAMQYLTSGIR